MKRLNVFALSAVVALAVVGVAMSPGEASASVQWPIGADAFALNLAFGGLIINATNLKTLYTAYNAAFQGGLGSVKPMYERVATTVPSSTSSNEYGWMGQFPMLREWLGDRVVHGIQAHSYSIKNKPFELTIGVDRDSIEDDQYGVFTPMFTEMGRSTAAHPDHLVWPLLKAGFNTLCYDGQNFFDTDHPVLDENGQETSVANTDGGAGAPWFLMDVSRALKPIIYQKRRSFDFVAMDQPTAENVFNKKEFKYGVDGRDNVGFAFWQFAWGSKQALDAAHFATAFAGLETMKGDHGRPLGISPNLLVVGPSNRQKGLELVNAERNAAGATNVWKGTVELLVVPWLA